MSGKSKREICPSSPINKVETTTDCLSDRGGLLLFSRYLFTVGVLAILEEKFGHLRLSLKGLPIWQIFHQVLCFFLDGTSHHLTRFDELKEDLGYAAAIETTPQQMASSHQVKRFFKLFAFGVRWTFRSVLKRLFIWRLKIEKPTVIELMADTVVLDNDQAEKREGVKPTYKRVKGLEPFQINWNHFTVDAIFRSGSKHGNYEGQAVKALVDLVKLIRSDYSATATIIVRWDAALFDQDNFAKLDEQNIGFIATGKMYPFVKEHMEARRYETWGEYRNDRQIWDYLEFGYRCNTWPRFYRAFYTVPRLDKNTGQLVLEFIRPENIILTNLGVKPEILQHCSAEEQERLLDPQTIITSHHQRGADELPHRALKDFGTEQLPLQRFAQNQAFYYIMLIAFFLYEAFKRDVLADVLPVTVYPTTLRRKIIDIAAKIVSGGHQRILKITESIMKRLDFQALWQKCQNPPPILA